MLSLLSASRCLPYARSLSSRVFSPPPLLSLSLSLFLYLSLSLSLSPSLPTSLPPSCISLCVCVCVCACVMCGCTGNPDTCVRCVCDVCAMCVRCIHVCAMCVLEGQHASFRVSNTILLDVCYVCVPFGVRSPDARMVFVDVGVGGFHVEFTLDEALAFIAKKQLLLQRFRTTLPLAFVLARALSLSLSLSLSICV